MIENQKKIIELFVDQELFIAALYERFSNSFPEHRDFWLHMASEERTHADWIQQLLSGEISDKVYFAEGKTRINTAKTYIEYLKNIISGIDNKAIDMLKALALSKDLETSLMERNMFKHFESDSSEVKKVFAYLEKQQALHCERITEKLSHAHDVVYPHR